MTAMQKPRLRMTMRGGQLVPVASQYEGASHKKRMAGKGTTISGPNGAIEHSLPTLQARSHNAIRNNAYAASAKEKYVSNLVGSGIKPQWGDAATQALWDRWVNECDADGVGGHVRDLELASATQALQQFQR